MAHTKQQLEAMKPAELVKLYNTLAGTSIKRFETKNKGIERIMKWQEEHPETPPASQATTTTRTVSKMAGKIGRPPLDYTVKVKADGAGKSHVRESSLRGKILAHLKANGMKARVQQLEQQFGRKARGAVLKLIEVNWLERDDSAQPTFAST
jgi:hypothetical protein